MVHGEVGSFDARSQCLYVVWLSVSDSVCNVIHGQHDHLEFFSDLGQVRFQVSVNSVSDSDSVSALALS